jgi:hypothetical protein
MAEKRWITGEEILERWQAFPFELVEAVLTGGLLAIEDISTGERHTAKNDKCFFCTESLEQPQACLITEDEFAPGVQLYGSDEFATLYCTYCYDENPGMTPEVRTSYRVKKVNELNFRLPEVEAYEQAHGLGPLPHKPETAEALSETLRAAGITDASIRAKMISAAFELPLRELGAIMTGKPDDDGNSAANIKTAQRLLGKTK